MTGWDKADPNEKEKIVITVYYGPARKIFDMESIHLFPQDASDLVKTIEVLVLGYPALHKFEVPENEVEK